MAVVEQDRVTVCAVYRSLLMIYLLRRCPDSAYIGEVASERERKVHEKLDEQLWRLSLTAARPQRINLHVPPSSNQAARTKFEPDLLRYARSGLSQGELEYDGSPISGERAIVCAYDPSEDFRRLAGFVADKARIDVFRRNKRYKWEELGPHDAPVEDAALDPMDASRVPALRAAVANLVDEQTRAVAAARLDARIEASEADAKEASWGELVEGLPFAITEVAARQKLNRAVARAERDLYLQDIRQLAARDDDAVPSRLRDLVDAELVAEQVEKRDEAALEAWADMMWRKDKLLRAGYKHAHPLSALRHHAHMKATTAKAAPLVEDADGLSLAVEAVDLQDAEITLLDLWSELGSHPRGLEIIAQELDPDGLDRTTDGLREQLVALIGRLPAQARAALPALPAA